MAHQDPEERAARCTRTSLSTRRKNSKRALVAGALAVAVLTATLVMLRWKSIVGSIVTSAAIADARSLLSARRPHGELEEEVQFVGSELARDWKHWFEAGYLNRSMLLERIASRRDATEALIVFVAFQQVAGKQFPEMSELLTCFEHIAHSFRAKDLLVDMFLGELPWILAYPDAREGLNLIKAVSYATLFFPDTSDPSPMEFLPRDERQRLFGLVSDAAWQSIIGHTRAPRERTRAGALLLLYRHPDTKVLEAEAQRALGDPSPLVKLAAAGMLALKGSDSGEKVLVDGMSHQSWEVRFWCLETLAAIGKNTLALMDQWLAAEKDEWLLSNLNARLRQARAPDGSEAEDPEEVPKDPLPSRQ